MRVTWMRVQERRLEGPAVAALRRPPFTQDEVCPTPPRQIAATPTGGDTPATPSPHGPARRRPLLGRRRRRFARRPRAAAAGARPGPDSRWGTVHGLPIAGSTGRRRTQCSTGQGAAPRPVRRRRKPGRAEAGRLPQPALWLAATRRAWSKLQVGRVTRRGS